MFTHLQENDETQFIPGGRRDELYRGNDDTDADDLEDEDDELTEDVDAVEDDGQPVLDEADLEENDLTEEEADDVSWEEPD